MRDATVDPYSVLETNHLLQNCFDKASHHSHDDEFIKTLDNKVNAEPGKFEHYLQRGYLWMENAGLSDKKHYEDALVDFRKAGELGTPFSCHVMGGAHCLRMMGKSQEAIDYCHAELTKQKDDRHFIHRTMGALYEFGLKELDKAQACYHKAVASIPEDSAAYRIRGEYYTRQNKRQEAEDDFKEVQRLNPNSSGLTISYSQVLISWGEKEQAEKLLTDAVEHFPNNLTLHEQLSIYYHAHNDPAKAAEVDHKIVDICEDDLKKNPKDIFLHNKIISVATRQQDYLEALKGVDRLLAIEPKNDTAWMTRNYNLYVRNSKNYQQHVTKPVHVEAAGRNFTISRYKRIIYRLTPQKRSKLERYLRRIQIETAKGLAINTAAIAAAGGVAAAYSLIPLLAVSSIPITGGLTMPLVAAGGGLLAANLLREGVKKVAKAKRRRDQVAFLTDNHAGIALEETLTTPEILIKLATYHSDCTDKHKIAFANAVHEIYSIPENRPIMDVAAWKATQGKDLLRIQVVQGYSTELLGTHASGFASHTGKLAIAISPDDIAQTGSVLIHELAHIAAGEVHHNFARVYENTWEAAADYKQVVDSSIQEELKAYSINGQKIVDKMLEPYTATKSYGSDAWQAERMVRIPQLATQVGYAPIEKIYPQEVSHFRKFLDKCRELLREKAYMPKDVPLPVSTHTAVDDLTDVHSLAAVIFHKAQFKGWGTIRCAMDYDAKNKEMKRITELLIDSGVSHDLIAASNDVDLDDFCNNMAVSYQQSFGRGLLNSKRFDPARVKDNTLKSAMEDAKSSFLGKQAVNLSEQEPEHQLPSVGTERKTQRSWGNRISKTGQIYPSDEGIELVSIGPKTQSYLNKKSSVSPIRQ